jgi:5'-nucleotidase
VIAGSSARALGRIVFDWDGRQVRCTSVDLLRAFSDSMQVASWDPFVALVDSMRAIAKPYTQRVLGRANRQLNRAALANLVTDAMREATHADVAITNPGGLRRNIEAGPVTAGDIFELLPFENSLVVVELTGAQLRDVIASRPDKSRVSGLRGRWDPAQAPEARLDLREEGGAPLRLDHTYRVVTTNFLASGGDGFKGFEAGAPTDQPLLLRDVVGQAIERRTAAGQGLDPDPTARLQLPESRDE